MQTTTLKTPIGRCCFPSLFKPKAFNDGDPEKFAVTVVFEEGADLKELVKAAEEAAQNKWGKDRPKNLRLPFRSTDEYDGKAGFEEPGTFVRFQTDRKPQVVNRRGDNCEEEEVYPGCYIRVSCRPYAYDYKGNCGVAFGLNNVLFYDDGERLAGGSRAKDDFSDDFDGETSSYNL